VKTRLVSVRAGSAQAARPARGRRGVTTQARCRGCHRRARLRSCVPVRSARLAEAGPASGARERTFGLYQPGIGRSRGRARGLWWLQKSTSGAGSRPAKGQGLAPWLPFAGAPGAKGRRKPGRGGESHEHASSDTGGGLLVIPRTERASGTCDRGREHSAMEGVRTQRRAVAFDEAAAARGTAIRGDGDAVAPAREGPGPPRIASKDVRGSVAGPDHGRQHLGRQAGRGGATDRGSTRTAPGPSRRRSGHSSRASQRHPSGGSRDGRGEGRSWSFAVKQGLHLAGSPGTRTGRSPQDLTPLGYGPG